MNAIELFRRNPERVTGVVRPYLELVLTYGKANDRGEAAHGHPASHISSEMMPMAPSVSRMLRATT